MDILELVIGLLTAGGECPGVVWFLIFFVFVGFFWVIKKIGILDKEAEPEVYAQRTWINLMLGIVFLSPVAFVLWILYDAIANG